MLLVFVTTTSQKCSAKNLVSALRQPGHATLDQPHSEMLGDLVLDLVNSFTETEIAFSIANDSFF